MIFLTLQRVLFDDSPSEVFSSFSMDILTLLVVVTAFALYKKEQLKSFFPSGLTFKRVTALIPISLAARIPIVLIIMIAIGIFGEQAMDTIDAGIAFQWSIFGDAKGVDAFLVFLSFVLIGPIHEELLFRGVMYPYLKKHYSVRTSMIYVTVVFTLFHFHPGLFPSSFALGLALVWVNHKWGNMGYNIILHMIINSHPFILEYLSTHLVQ